MTPARSRRAHNCAARGSGLQTAHTEGRFHEDKITNSRADLQELRIVISGRCWVRTNGGQSNQLLALSLARGFRHFWSGDYQACVHVVAPKVEAAARVLLLELDEGIYRLQAARDPGQYPGLYPLLHELEDLALDESWAYFLRWLLLGPTGQNIRNEVAHGFVGDISPVYAALVLRAAALLISIAGPQPASATHGTDGGPHRTSDLTELSRRDRDEVLSMLRVPVREPAARPGDGRWPTP